MKRFSFLVIALLSFCPAPMLPQAFAAQQPVLKTRDAVTPVQIRQVRPQVTTVPGQATFPEVLSVAPATLTQGQSATLLVTGKNLNRDMRIRLGEGITTGNPTLSNDRTASVSVVVAADAAPGTRVIQVQYRDQVKHSRAYINVLPAPVQALGTAISDQPPTLTTTNPARRPKVSAITPDSLERGRSYALTVTGSNLEDIRAVKIGTGITAGVADAASNRLKIDLTVAATARPGPRQVILVDKREQSHPAAVGVTVTAAAQRPSLPIVLGQRDTPLQIKPMGVAPTMTVRAVLPNQWMPGKSYRIEVQGSRFEEGLEAGFGSGIAVEDFEVASADKLTMTVKVSGSAAPGARTLRLRNGSSGRWTTFPAKAWVVAARKFSRSRPEPRLVKPDLTPSVLGRIVLLTPDDYLNPPSNTYSETINEQTLFTWSEQNPGLAEWYEFRLVTENGYVVEKKRISPVTIQIAGQQLHNLPTSLRMNTAYLVDLLTKDRMTSGTENGPHTTVHGMGNQIFWWEVAGYRTYTSMETVTVPGNSQSGIGKTQKKLVSKNVQVEISDRRALCFPSKPSGLACSESVSGMYNQSSLKVINTKSANGNGITMDNRTANYPGDQWELTGNLDISHVPYAAHLGANVNGPGDIAIRFANLFLDWGDGSGAIPLEIDFSQPSGLSYMPLGRAYHHSYQRSGNYTVRIFMLPEDDIQQGPPDALASVYDAVSDSTQASAGAVVPASSDYAPYYRVLKGIQAASGPGFRFSERGGPSFRLEESSLYAQAGRAHLLYCETKTISAREDLVAQGPLHLEAIAITGYNGSGSGGDPAAPAGPGAGKTKNKAGQSSQQKLTLSSSTQKPVQAVKKPVVGILTDAEISACGLLQGNADLVYYGKGRARITWSLNQGGSRMVVGSTDEPLASPQRTEGGMVLTEETWNVPSPESFATAPLPSPVLEMSEKMVDKNYSLMVEAEVLPQADQLDAEQILDLLRDRQQTIPLPSGSSFAKILSSWLISEAHAASTGFSVHPQLAALQQSGLKLSVLAPSKEGSSGRPVMASLNRLVTARTYPGFEVKKEKPFYVKSDPFRYRVKENDPQQPCKFVFPASTGDRFEITNLEVRNLGGKFKGSGILDMHLYTGPGGSAARYLLPIAINNWSLASDGLTVTRGSINHSLDYAVNEAGMRIKLKKLAGQAGQTPLNLTLEARPADTDLHLRGSTQPPEWTVTSPLSENGDWYHLETSEIEVAIGNSGFYLKPQEIVLDLSAEEGMAANPGGAGKAWAGLHFGDNALLIPNLFEFQVPDANKGRVSDWGIIGNHLTGKTELTTPFSTTYKEGSIGFSSISVNTGGNELAVYRGMDVDLPWPETHLTGDAKLVYGVPGQEAYFDFSEITQDEIVKEYRGLTVAVRNLLFGNFTQIGWGARSESTTFRFEAEDVTFADNVVVPGIIYAMDGRPYLENGSSIEIPLGGKSTLGQTPVDLTAVRIACFKSGPAVFGFDFDTTFSISEVLSSVAVPVHYALTRDGNMYQAEGPRVDPFDLEVAFPAGQPQVEAIIHIEYTGAGLSSSTADAGSSGFWSLFSVAEAHAASGARDSFAGSADMTMFDGPPIQAEFRLGYLGGRDYWLMRAGLDLGPGGIPFVPPFLNLYKIRGGLGHNFPLDAFKSNYPLTVVEPVMDGSYLFMAGMRIGSSDGFICTMDGDLTVKPGEGTRMDYRAWLLDAQHAGNGNFQGYLQYAAGGFDGSLSGHFSLLNDNIYFDIPENSCTVHFGSGAPWHIYVGEESGPKVLMHLLIRDVDGYMMLDETSLRLGGGVYYYLGCSIGHISGELKTGLTITPEPHVAGYGQGGVHADVCYKGHCIGTGISVRVDVSALPVSASARGCIKIPIPFWNPKICRTFSL